MTVKGKHLTQEDRHYIEDALNENSSLADIVQRLEKTQPRSQRKLGETE